MNNSRNESFTLLIRYQQQLKRKMQQTQNLVMDNKKDPATLNVLNSLIQEEQKLLKVLEVQSCQMQPQLRTLYSQNIQRFKKKIRNHKEYLDTYFGPNAYQSANTHDFRRAAIIQHQNLQLQNNKMTMYENEQVQNTMGHNLTYQGQVLRSGFDDHRRMREDAEEAEGAITLIQNAISKRKFMFGSLVVLFVVGLVIVVIKKANNVANALS